MIADHLRLRPGQKALTPEQEAEASRFAEARIAAQVSTEPVDESETEVLLKQAYAVAHLSPPTSIHWVDGPLQLVAALASFSVGNRGRIYTTEGVRTSVETGIGADVPGSVGRTARKRVHERVYANVAASVWDRVGASVEDSVRESMGDIRWGHVWTERVWAGAQAYGAASWLAYVRFFVEYLAPNAPAYLAHFNERVSGYWLGKREALVVRRPKVLARDVEGRLHSETGRCMEYADGWGFYAWHGVRVPKRVIFAPETLTREDVLKEENVEVRRVMQERMGQRFVSELGGRVLDTGPRGTLYEVELPRDPERVARYVQVQDASTERRYFLRVPPTTQTTAEAVAWTFQVPGEDYHPAQET